MAALADALTYIMLIGFVICISCEILLLPSHLISFIHLLIHRWKEVMDSAVGGGVSQIQTLVEKMPEVAEVSAMQNFTLYVDN